MRLDDNPALAAAMSKAERVLPLYIHAPQEESPWGPGAASRWWLHGSLASLDRDLRSSGSRLAIAQGDSLETLPAVATRSRPPRCTGIGSTSPSCARAMHESAGSARAGPAGGELQRRPAARALGGTLRVRRAVQGLHGVLAQVHTDLIRREPVAAPKTLCPVPEYRISRYPSSDCCPASAGTRVWTSAGSLGSPPPWPAPGVRRAHLQGYGLNPDLPGVAGTSALFGTPRGSRDQPAPATGPDRRAPRCTRCTGGRALCASAGMAGIRLSPALSLPQDPGRAP